MQFSDLKTNKVCYSELFKLRFPQIFETCKTNLESNGIKVETVGQNFNIWIRDFFPIQVDDHFVRFGYKGYSHNGIESGYEDYPWLQVPQKCFSMCKPLQDCDIVLDGGGIIRSEKHAIITEKVFVDNPKMSHEDIIKRLELILNCKIIIIPMEPGDWLGHADGICKFIDNETILVNDYSCFAGDPEVVTFNKTIMEAFDKAKLRVELMPYIYDQCERLTDDAFYKKFPFADDNNPGYGYYINFTLTKNTIIAPVFGVPEDKDAIATLKECYPLHNVIAVNCADLSMEGGLCSCVSWNCIE